MRRVFANYTSSNMSSLVPFGLYKNRWLFELCIGHRWVINSILSTLLWMFFSSIVAASDEIRLDNTLESAGRAGHEVQAQLTADLAGKRLFYDALERNDQKKNHEDNKNTSAYSENNGAESIRHEYASGDVVSDDAVSNGSEFQYSARIRSSNAIIVIVNDVPCTPVNRLTLAASSHGVIIDCKQPGSEFLDLLIQKDELTLSVIGAASSVSWLLPGDSL